MDPTMEIFCKTRNGQSARRERLSDMFSRDALWKVIVVGFMSFKKTAEADSIFTLLMQTTWTKVLGRPLLMNRLDYFSNFHEYKS